MNIANGCATGGSALTLADITIRSGAFQRIRTSSNRKTQQ